MGGSLEKVTAAENFKKHRNDGSADKEDTAVTDRDYMTDLLSICTVNTINWLKLQD